jgi:DNA modification methylase
MNEQHGTDWTFYNGDCVELMRDLPDNSIDFCIHSPPFSSLYIYSDSENDMGNAASDEEFFRHYAFAIKELYRLTVPGRLCAVHCKDLPRYANVYGTTGLIDFPGACIQEFEAAGWVFHSRVTIWKCPVTERERTNNNGLLHKTVRRDTSQVRQGMADYLIVFRKPPSEGSGLMSDKPIVRPKGFSRYIGEAGSSNDSHPSPFSRKKNAADPSIDIWRRYAEPVWWDINQTDVLNFKLATTENDEKHICPLQLGLIERAVDLWTLPGDVVFSPFGGVGSEGVGSLRCGRKFVGVELKESYWQHGCNFLRSQEEKKNVPMLPFDDVDDTSWEHDSFREVE